MLLQYPKAGITIRVSCSGNCYNIMTGKEVCRYLPVANDVKGENIFFQ